MTLSEKTSRRWKLAAFILFGPMVLLAVGAVVWYRTGPMSARAVSDELSAQFDAPVTIGRVRFLRPGSQKRENVTVAEKRTPFLFAPEIITRRADSSSNASDAFLSILPNRSSDSNVEQAALFDSVRTKGTKGSAQLWEIPVLCVRASKTDTLLALLRRMSETDTPMDTVRFEIERLEFLDDEAFERRMKDAAQNMATADCESKADTQRQESENSGAVDGSDAAIRERVKRFVQGEALCSVRGIWCTSVSWTLLAFSADPLEMAADSTRPTWLMLNDHTQENAPNMIFFDSFGVPFPTFFAAKFFPTLKIAGNESWFSGRLVATRQKGTNEIALTDFSLADSALESMLAPVTPLTMTGEVHRLTIDSGKIDGGVFIGKGSLRLDNVRLAKSFLVKTGDALRLVFNPPTAVVNRFENDAVPFDQLQFGFELTRDGVTLSSEFPSGVIGVFKSSATQYSLFLPTEGEKTFCPYPDILSALGDEKSPYWSPFYRNAINRLPVE